MSFFEILSPIKWLFLAHALVGTIALLSFAIPLFAKKGGKLHVKAGWVYIYAMILVGASALIITPWRILFDPFRTPGSQGFALFLFFISIFTLAALYFGLRVLKLKTRKLATRAVSEIGPPILIIVFGLATQIAGLLIGDILLIVFPVLGYMTAASQLKYWLRAPQEKMHWWFAHMQGMFVACIATVTAFLVTALPRIWPGPLTQSPWLWLAPGVIMGQVLRRWTAAYRHRFR